MVHGSLLIDSYHYRRFEAACTVSVTDATGWPSASQGRGQTCNHLVQGSNMTFTGLFYAVACGDPAHIADRRPRMHDLL